MTIAWAIFAAIRASRPLQLGVVLLAGMLGWHGWLAVHDKKVATGVKVALDQEHKALAKKAGAARAGAERPGAEARLRMRYQEDGQ